MAIAEIHSKPLDAFIFDRMHLDEAESVAKLFAQVLEGSPYYNERAKKSELDKYRVNSLREALLSDPDSVLVAKSASRIVGFCFSHDDDGVIWLSWFGVDPECRQMGIGCGLLCKLEAVRRGTSHKIWCDCRTENEASKSTLNRHGYVQLCTIQNHWYGQDFILWERLL